MKFIRFLENTYQERQVDQAQAQQRGGFLTLVDAEINALEYITWAFRLALGVLLIPKVLVCYALVQCRLRAIPKPAIDLLKAQQQQGLNKKRRKLGFQEQPMPPVPEANA